jgi:hypothetical protein
VYGQVSQARYRIDSRDSLAMEMPDGSFQRTLTVKSAFITLSLIDRGGSFAAEVSLDSLMLDRPNQLVQPLVDSALGTRWAGAIARNGRIDSLVPNKSSVFGEQVRTMLHRLIAILPADGAEPGEGWRDSSTVAYQIMSGFSASEQRLAEFRAEKWEEVRGTRTLTVASTTRYRLTGSGSGFGQEIRLEGTGEAAGKHRISTAGRLIQAEVKDSANMTLTVPAVGQSVPTVMIATYTLTTLP